MRNSQSQASTIAIAAPLLMDNPYEENWTLPCHRERASTTTPTFPAFHYGCILATENNEFSLNRVFFGRPSLKSQRNHECRSFFKCS